MSAATRTSRRSLLGAIAGGAVLGGVWGVAFPALAQETRSTLAVVGRGGAQLVLVDSTEARALILVGELDASLLDRLPAVMTLFRQRIDLMIAEQSVLLGQAGQLGDRWGIRHVISLQQHQRGATPSIPTTTVTDGMTIDLGRGMSMHCRIGHRGEWDRRSPSAAVAPALWTIALQHPGGTVVIAPDPASLDAATPVAADLLISPDVPSPGIASRLPVQACASNNDSETLEGNTIGKTVVTRIYPDDIARFVLHEQGIDLPPWSR